MTRALPSVGSTGHSARDVARVQLVTDGRMAGSVRASRHGDTLLLNFSLAYGHLPADTRLKLIKQAFRLPELNVPGQRVLVTIPLGDTELLHGLRVRLGEVQVRAAGATCLVEATTR